MKHRMLVAFLAAAAAVLVPNGVSALASRVPVQQVAQHYPNRYPVRIDLMRLPGDQRWFPRLTLTRCDLPDGTLIYPNHVYWNIPPETGHSLRPAINYYRSMFSSAGSISLGEIKRRYDAFAALLPPEIQNYLMATDPCQQRRRPPVASSSSSSPMVSSLSTYVTAMYEQILRQDKKIARMEIVIEALSDEYWYLEEKLKSLEESVTAADENENHAVKTKERPLPSLAKPDSDGNLDAEIQMVSPSPTTVIDWIDDIRLRIGIFLAAMVLILAALLLLLALIGLVSCCVLRYETTGRRVTAQTNV